MYTEMVRLIDSMLQIRQQCWQPQEYIAEMLTGLFQQTN
jgi:hypothetical protein